MALMQCCPLLHYQHIPLSHQSRKVQFTCVDASENIIVCGASNGCVFLFVRSSSREDSGDISKTVAKAFVNSKYYLVKMVSPSANDRIAISCVSIDPFQKHLIAGTCRGAIYGIQLTEYHKIGEKIEFTHDFHAGYSITCLLWDPLGTKIFSACSSGSVCVTMMREGVSAYFGAAQTELLLKEDTGIVQLDYHKKNDMELLLVSSQQRSMILDLNVLAGNAIQIGTKARHGLFGGCFGTVGDTGAVQLFCARPGRRVWVADPISGCVSSTLKFSIDKAPTVFVQKTECSDRDSTPKDIALGQLSCFQFRHEPYLNNPKTSATHLMVSWRSGSGAIFFLDAASVEIVEWHVDLGIIHDLKVLDDHTLIVLHGSERIVSFVHSCSASQFLDIYAQGDLTKSVNIAIRYNINDAWVLEVLRGRWIKEMSDRDNEADQEFAKIREKLEELTQNAKQLLDQHRADTEDLDQYVEAQPLQVIYKQRPRKQAAQSFPNDLIAYDDRQESIIMAGKMIHRGNEYSQIEAAPVSNVKGVNASASGGRLAAIADLSPSSVIIDESSKAQWQQSVENALSLSATSGEFVKDQPSWRQTFNVSTQALITLLPNTLTIPGFANTLGNTQSLLSAGHQEEMLCDPSAFKGLELDPIETDNSRFLFQTSILRAASSALSENHECLGSEMLLEAISSSLWISSLKYDSTLPLHKQLSFMELQVMDDQTQVERHATRLKGSPMHSKQSAQLPLSPKLPRRISVGSPTGAKGNKRPMQLFVSSPFGDLRKICMLSGNLGHSMELESIRKRDIAELRAELAAATSNAANNRVAKRIWPASGITRICACLTNVYLQHGNTYEAQHVMQQWLQCFDPDAELSTLSNSEKQDASIKWTRGRNPVDDGLPLTRSDWNTVRLLISLYFTIRSIGPSRIIDPLSKLSENELCIDAFASEMGIAFVFRTKEANEFEIWLPTEAQRFIDKYGPYLSLEIAAQICILRGYSEVLFTALNKVVSGSSMSTLCTNVIDWIADNHIKRTMQTLYESDSLCLILHVLDLLFKKAPEEASRLCVAKYPIIQPCNVERILFGGKISQLELSEFVQLEHSRSQTLNYFAYMVQLLQNKDQETETASTVFKDCVEIICADRRAAEAILQKYTGWACSTWLRNMLCNNKCSFSRGLDREWLWQVMKEQTELPVLVELCIASLSTEKTIARGLDQVREIIEYVIENDEYIHQIEALIEGIAMYANVYAHSAIEIIFASLNTSLLIKPKLVEAVFVSILNVYGAERLYDYLCQYSYLASSMPYSAFVKMIRNLMLTREGERQLYQMLEIADAHIWRSGPNPLFSPELEAVFDIERGATQVPIEAEDLKLITDFGDCSDQIDAEKALRRLYEFRNSVWGGEIQLHDSFCAVCDLPLILVTKVENENVPVMLLSCGHAFHEWCIPDISCCICIEAGYCL